MTLKITFHEVYCELLKTYGPQDWWPAETSFEVMVGAILTQNTAWTNVERAIKNLKQNNCLAPEKILEASVSDLAEWLRPSGYFNIKAKRLRNFCTWYINSGQYKALSSWGTERLRNELLTVNGIGPETADDMLLYAFERPVFVIDAYTRRLFSRLGYDYMDEGYEKIRFTFEDNLQLDAELFNEYHALIVFHAKEVCKKIPNCGSCCLLNNCGYSEN